MAAKLSFLAFLQPGTQTLDSAPRYHSSGSGVPDGGVSLEARSSLLAGVTARQSRPDQVPGVCSGRRVPRERGKVPSPQRTASPTERGALSFQRAVPPSQRTGPPFQRTGLSSQRAVPPFQRTGLPFQRTGLSFQRTAFSPQRAVSPKSSSADAPLSPCRLPWERWRPAGMSGGIGGTPAMVAAHGRRPGLRPNVLRRPARRQRSQGERAALTVVAIQKSRDPRSQGKRRPIPQ